MFGVDLVAWCFSVFVVYGLGGWICMFGLFVFSCDFVNSVAIVLFFVLGSFSVGSCYFVVSLGLCCR